MKLVRYLANLGYGSRRQVEALLAEGRVARADGSLLEAGAALAPGVLAHEDIRVDGAPLDPAPGVLAMLHKPVGYVCSTRDAGRLVHDLLPPRWKARRPQVSSIGRLDRDTSGLLLLTDDGVLLHRVIAPRSKLPKVYEAALAQDLRGGEAGLFASGTLVLQGEGRPLAPARLEPLGPRRARLVLTEGRYHQARRMFAAVGNHVLALHRARIGGLDLGDLPEGRWRLLDEADRTKLFARDGGPM
ncbi:MAG: pseudouridine synthase [Gammaproteobacteria bacterium]